MSAYRYSGYYLPSAVASTFQAAWAFSNGQTDMKKNVASQSIGAQMITAADGTAFTGTVTVVITIDNGTQAASAGTAPAHEGNGYHSYTPTQAETNGDHIAFTFTGSGAIPQTIQAFTTFPQTVDNATDITAILADTSELQTNQGNWLTATNFATTAEIANVPTVAEFNARTLLAASYFDPTADAVANVTLVATTTTNTDMLAATDIVSAGAITTLSGAIVNVDLVDTTTTNTDMVAAAPTVSDILTTQMTESYAADGVAPTLAEAVFITMQNLQEVDYASTTQTVKKIDGSTTAATYTMDDATNPTNKTRAT